MKIVVVGVGNPILRDDSVGLKVAERAAEELRKRGIDVHLELMTTTDFDVISKISGYDCAVIVDGLLGDEPGKIRVMNLEDFGPSLSFSGSHSLSLPTSLKIGYELFGEEMPEKLAIVAIEVEDPYTFSTECTEKVERAIPSAVKKVVEIVEGWI